MTGASRTPDGRNVHFGLPVEPLLSVLVSCPDGQQSRWLRRRLDDQVGCCRQSIELLVDVAIGRSTGQQRQYLLERARGDYVTWLAADDEVHAEYVAALAAACRRGYDLISHGPPTPSARWVWRRSVACRIAWSPDPQHAADRLWCLPLLASGLIRSREHLSRWLCGPPRGCEPPPPTPTAEGDGVRCFRREDGELLIEVPSGIRGDSTVLVRDRDNDRHLELLQDLDHVCTVTP